MGGGQGLASTRTGRTKWTYSFAGLQALGGIAGGRGVGNSGAEPLAEGGVTCSGKVLV